MLIPFQTTNWESIPTTEHQGETGIALMKTLQFEKIRVRMIEYSPRYKADHWCSLGHIIFCVEGEFVSHMKDGRDYLIKKGMSYQTSDDPENPHRSTSENGCTLFVVDGDFLK